MAMVPCPCTPPSDDVSPNTSSTSAAATNSVQQDLQQQVEELKLQQSEMDLLMVNAIHPCFKLPVVHLLNPNEVDTEHAVAIDTAEASASSADKNGEDHFFKELGVNMPMEVSSHLSNKMSREFKPWWSKKSTSYSLDQSMFPTLQRAAWVDVFLKYNTAIPTSAAMERLLSKGSDIMKPKRASLISENFEHLTFMKGNMVLLKTELSPLLLKD
ncbi:hypothetical protein O3P69_004954 [Scylla paramamosain]|uniref:Uncharacterized protein n=1 Tax=Scylla paramamosain TaxID=85552 RepID=A0AAW0UBB9_SCYPA